LFVKPGVRSLMSTKLPAWGAGFLLALTGPVLAQIPVQTFTDSQARPDAPVGASLEARAFGHRKTAATLSFLAAVSAFSDEAGTPGGQNTEAWLDLTLRLDPSFSEARALEGPMRAVVRARP
jgi:hypothetical protein